MTPTFVAAALLYSHSPTGQSVDVPENASEDVQSFSVTNIQEALAYFQAEGFVVIRDVIPAACYQKAMRAFSR
jgi:hypothetical protein